MAASTRSDRWTIPPELQPHCLRLYLTGHSARSIYLQLWPPNGEVAPPIQLPGFTIALQNLQRDTELEAEQLAKQEGVPTQKQLEEARGNDEQMAKLALYPAVMELPFAGADAEALAHLDAARGAIAIELRKVMDDPVPEFDLRENPLIQVQWRKERSVVISTLANALNMNVMTRLRASQMRTERTVQLHNLRLGKLEVSEMVSQRIEKEDQTIVLEHRKTKSGFKLDME